MNPSTVTARALLSALLGLGMRDVVVSPGSRSAPLAYALAQLDAAGLLRVRVRIDEREAAFLALGIAKGTRAAGIERPVGLVTTSGTAVANLHPAILEASYGHLPLIALTADRPARLRATGANQTLDDQSAVLSDVRARFDIPADEQSPQRAEAVAVEAVDRALGEGFATGYTPGPVQLNVQFDVPLVPEAADMSPWWPSVPAQSAAMTSVPLAPRFADDVLPALGRHTVVLSGDAFDYSAERLAAVLRRHRLPVLAEPSSPLASAPDLVVGHTRVLDERPDLVERVTDLIVLGKPTLTRQDQRLLSRSGIRTHRVQPDLDRVAGEVWEQTLAAADLPAAVPGWTEEWLAAGHTEQELAEQELAESVAQSARDGQAETAQDLPAAVARAVLSSPGTVFAGSSNAVRYLDRAITVESAAGVHASRGLAGIDGLVSTAVGFAQGSGAPVRLLIGDVAMLHGIGGLLRESGEDFGEVQIFVLNDDGGAIFAGLEHGRSHLAPFFPRFFAASHGRAFADFARGYGVAYSVCATPAEVAAAVMAGAPGIYEIPLEPVRSPGAS